MPADDLTLALRVRADVQQALGQMRRMQGSLGNIDKRGRRADRTMRSLARTALRVGAAYLGFRAIVGVIRSVVGATEEQQQAIAQVERGLRNLEGQTALTSQGLQDHAAALQQVTTTGDEAILRLQSLLLTFRNIDETNFNRVTEASLDLAAAIGQAPRDAALQLGKALEDPVQGLTALRRSGTVFSAEQTKVIRNLAETNRLAEAQAVILAEVERQYRGAAQAQRETVGAAAAALGNTFGDLLEARDGAEDLRVSIEGLNTAVKDPGFSRAVRDFVDVFVSGLALIADGAAEVVEGLGDIYSALNGDPTRAGRIRRFARGDDDAISPADLRNNPRLLAIARDLEATLAEAAAQAEPPEMAEPGQAVPPAGRQRQREAEIAAANRAAAEGMTLGIERRLAPEAPTVAEQRAAELERAAPARDERRDSLERLRELIRLATIPIPEGPFAPPGFTFPGALPAPAETPADPRAAEQAVERLLALRADAEERTAQLTLGRIALVDRAERQAVAEARALGEVKGADAAEVEATVTAIRARFAAERRQIVEAEAVAETNAVLDALEREAQAREEAAREHADAAAAIEGREIELGIIPQYQAAVLEAERWRSATLADLDETAEGYEALRARAEVVYAALIAAAEESRDRQKLAADDWIGGVREALRQIEADSITTADAAREATLGAFRAMEDAVSEFVRTGRFNFSSFVDSVIADLARLATRRFITQPLAQLLLGSAAELHAGGTVGALGGVRRPVPALAFAAAPRLHEGGVAGLRADEVPIIAQRGETVLPRGAQIAAPAVEINFDNRGTPQREVSREVRLDPRGLVVSIVTDDIRRGGPIRRTIAHELGGGLP